MNESERIEQLLNPTIYRESELTKLTRDALELSQSMKKQWEGYVQVSFGVPDEGLDDIAKMISGWAKTGIESVRRKIVAIHYAHAHLGLSKEDIVEMGQEETLSRFQKKKRAEKYEKDTRISWVIPGSQAELVRQSIERIKKVCGLTNEEFFDFWLSFFQGLTDDELKYLAGDNLTQHAQKAIQKNG
jgi:hypothetical protein